MGQIVGLNYQSVEVLLRILEVKDPASVFDDVQIMEAEALRIFQERNA